MTPVFLLRLVFDFVALGLFLIAMAYWWMDNGTHELVGTAMFALLFLHNVFNRRWYGSLPRTRRRSRPLVTMVLNLTLLVTMSALLATSVLISQWLFVGVAVGGTTARDLHISAAYWAMLIVSLHLGLHWQIVMNAAKRILGIVDASRARTVLMRLAAVAVAAGGVYAFFDLDISSRLLLIPTMEFWDFNADTSGFFFRVAAIVGFFCAVGHYASTAMRRPIERHLPSAKTSQG